MSSAVIWSDPQSGVAAEWVKEPRAGFPSYRVVHGDASPRAYWTREQAITAAKRKAQRVNRAAQAAAQADGKPRRFTIFAYPGSDGLTPVWGVFDRNVRCDAREFADSDKAQKEADRRNLESEA